MPVIFGQMSMIFWFFHSYLITTVLINHLHISNNILRAEASYSLDGILINLYTLDGAGNMVIDLTNVNVNLYAGLSIDDQGYVQIDGLQLDADFSDANLQLEHLNLDGDLSESISRVISRYVHCTY